MSFRKKIGLRGEDLACKWLTLKNYEILARNFRCRGGEIDVVAQHEREIVFIEVKTRQNDRFGFPEEAVDNSKLLKIKKAAEVFIDKNNLFDHSARIDVIAILGKKIRHIIDVASF